MTSPAKEVHVERRYLVKPKYLVKISTRVHSEAIEVATVYKTDMNFTNGFMRTESADGDLLYLREEDIMAITIEEIKDDT